LLLFVAVMVALLIGVNRTGSVPPPLWSQSDLPTVPSPADNGWIVLQKGMRSAGRLDIPSAALSICRADSAASAEDRWKTLEREKLVVEKFLAEPATVDVLRLVGEASGKREFADACEVDAMTSCPFLSLLRAHNAAELKVLLDAHENRWSVTWLAAVRLLGMDLGHLKSARTGFSNMAAIASTSRTVELLALLAHRYERRPDGTVAADPEVLAGPGAMLDSLSVDGLTMERAVVTEYLFLLSAIDAIQDDPSAAGISHRRWDPLFRGFFDPAATRAELNQYYSTLGAFARSPGKAHPPPPPNLRSGSLWWVHNAAGKLVLEQGLADFGDVIAQYETRKSALAARVKLVRQALRELEQKAD